MYKFSGLICITKRIFTINAENCGEDGAMKAARIAALLKYIQASTHTKSQVLFLANIARCDCYHHVILILQTGDAVTPEDVERNKAYILEVGCQYRCYLFLSTVNAQHFC